MELYCGTSGFSFKEWKGFFYPEKLPAGEMLAFYSAHLPTVEINNTFYRMPRQNVLEGWAAQVPETFRFAVKAPRRISHSKQLEDCEEEAGYFFGVLAALGARLGCVLVQLPPHARADAGKLASFLALVPKEIPVALEFRHPSWKSEEVHRVLADHGAALVVNDDDADVPEALPATAPWAYLRLRAPEYTDEDLRQWRVRCQRFDRAYVYFKHEDEGAGPKLAKRMLEL